MPWHFVARAAKQTAWGSWAEALSVTTARRGFHPSLGGPAAECQASRPGARRPPRRPELHDLN